MSPTGINGVDKQGVGINGVQVKQTLDPANDTVNEGVYEATTLSAIDADLATGNIKNGITIFGKAGSADVFDISDATAVEAEVLDPETFYAVGGGIRTGSMPTVAIVAANDNYPAGYHVGNVGGLDAIEVNLAAANILSGVNIFGYVGVATVQDIADADAAVANVLDPKTFYSVTGARKTGTMPTVALAAGSNAYPAGYHAGNVGGLDAVDADLVTANIKSGITIFDVAGSVDVRDSTDADLVVAEAPTGKTFYAGGGARKTGTGTKTLNPANETVAAGYYAATTLSAVDGDLAAANIKDGVTIFGFLGTLSATLAEDVIHVTQSAKTCTFSSFTAYGAQTNVVAGGDIDLVTKNDTYDTDSMAVASAVLCGIVATAANALKIRLYMDGTQVAESAFISNAVRTDTTLIATRALSGSDDCKIGCHNYDASDRLITEQGVSNGQPVWSFLTIGSIKKV